MDLGPAKIRKAFQPQASGVKTVGDKTAVAVDAVETFFKAYDARFGCRFFINGDLNGGFDGQSAGAGKMEVFKVFHGRMAGEFLQERLGLIGNDLAVGDLDGGQAAAFS